MSNPNKNGAPQSTRQFIIALVIVLSGVIVGFFLIQPHEGRRSWSKPSALGHEIPAMPRQPSTNGMVWIPGGSFWMGSEDGNPDEKPVHQVTIDGFWMDKTEVTNEEFAEFV